MKKNRNIKSKYNKGDRVYLKKNYKGYFRNQILYVINCYKQKRKDGYCIIVSESANDEFGVAVPTKYIGLAQQ